MEVFAICFSVLSTVLLVYLYLNGCFDVRVHKAYLLCIAFLLYGLGLLALNFVPALGMLRLIYNTSAAVILSVVLYRAKLPRAILYAILLSAALSLTELLIMTVFSAVGWESSALISHSAVRSIYLISSQLVNYLVLAILLRFLRGAHAAIPAALLLLLLPGCIAGIAVCCLFGLAVLDNRPYPPLPFLLAATGLAYLNILVFFYTQRVSEINQRQKEAALAEQKYKMQERYDKQLQDEQNDTRAMFHDINKIMCAMRTMVSEHNSDEAAKMLAQTQEVFAKLGNTVDVGNREISVILNEYQLTARQSGISFSFDVSVPPEMSVETMDLYIILGNSLDNAIEACRAIPDGERFIRLQLRKQKNLLFYKLENPDPGDWYAKRTRGKQHGFGLKSIQRCVEKYDGELDTRRENGSYILMSRISCT